MIPHPSTAIHEAGHWAVAEALGFTVDVVTACAVREGSGGFCSFRYPELPPDPPMNPWVHGKGSRALWDTPWHTRRNLEARIVVALAGGIAESEFAGRSTTPARTADDALADRLAMTSGLVVTESLVAEGAGLAPLDADEETVEHLARLLVDETAHALVELLRIAARQLVLLYEPAILRRADLLLDVGSVRLDPSPPDPVAIAASRTRGGGPHAS